MESESKSPQGRVIVLCFDGTGNTFRVDGGETNIMKIFRMLDRTQDHHFCYYQPGIGTDITPTSLASTTVRRQRSIFSSKASDLALGHSFDKHLMGGYRFLMRHYRSDAKIYIFGFSRGAYTARFLNEMLDYVGLLSPDNEEMIPFVWKAFAKWRLRPPVGTEKRSASLKEAFEFLRACRQSICRPIRRVEFLGLFDTVNSIAEMQVNTRMIPSSKVIRHAVSIDERRVKFQPVLLQPRPKRRSTSDSARRHHLGRNGNQINGPEPDDDDYQDIEEVWFPGCHSDIGGGYISDEKEAWPLSHAPLVWMVHEAVRAGLQFNWGELHDLNCCGKNASSDEPMILDGEKHEESYFSKPFIEALERSATDGVGHDSLKFGKGGSAISVMSWNLLECLPWGRMSIMEDEVWKMKHWPLPLGSARDIPLNAVVHVSALRRLKSGPNYRPGNLILGGYAGRGSVRAPKEYGIGEWEIFQHENDPVREMYIRKDIRT